MDKKTLQRYRHQKAVFCSLRSVKNLCHLLKVDHRRLLLMAQRPPYNCFTIPKKGGGERQIEAPASPLKKVLNRLNVYLQSTYYFERSRAAYGFILGIKNNDDRRNVLTNAKKHVGKPYMLNLDLKVFFHSVTRDKVLEIFLGPPFNFRDEMALLLADVTTFKGRLPMGTSTSPVLSNFACRGLDQEMTELADAMLWNYTRYADDMTFSSGQPIHAEKLNSIRKIIERYHFVVNEKKLRLYGPDDDKVVTGLVVTDEVSLAPDYLSLLKEEIARLQAIIKSQNEQGQLSTRWVEQFKQQVRGRLSFAGFVLPRQSQEIVALKDAYYSAINPEMEDFGAVSWRGFPYNF